MTVEPYRLVLAIPGVRGLTLVALLARIPITATGVVLTLHVVLGLGHGYGAAGTIGGAFTIGAAIGAPLLGRIVDRHGLRRMLVLTTIAEAVFWSLAPWLPYPALLVAALVSGVVSLPVFSVVRQSLAALVPEDQRRTAYSMDSMSVELSFMVGPMFGVLVATQVSTTAALLTLGAMIVTAGVTLYVFNPPVTSERPAGEPDAWRATNVSWRSWLGPQLVSVLVVTAAAAVVLAGTDVAIVAALQRVGEVSWTGVVFVAWAGASLIGGFIYGALPRAIPPLVLLGLLGLLTIPVGLAGSWWTLGLALVPAGLLCAPTLAATADAVSRVAPEPVRGLVMGVHGSALTAGLAIGAPLAGVVVDWKSPAWAFAVAGGIGAVVAGLALVALRLGARLAAQTAEPVRAGAGR